MSRAKLHYHVLAVNKKTGVVTIEYCCKIKCKGKNGFDRLRKKKR